MPNNRYTHIKTKGGKALLGGVFPPGSGELCFTFCGRNPKIKSMKHSYASFRPSPAWQMVLLPKQQELYDSCIKCARVL
jgi:hypothetical protein